MSRYAHSKPPWLRMPPRYMLASLLTAMGGFLLGFDTSTIGPVTVMPSYIAHFGQHSPSVHGIVVSSILLSAAVTSFIAGRPADVLGRPRAIALGVAVFTVGVAMQAGATGKGLAMFMVGRVTEGAGFGLYFGTLTVLLVAAAAGVMVVTSDGGISPPSQRGPLTTGPQWMICLGLVAGYFTCYGTGTIPGSLSWRLPFVILGTISTIFIAAVLVFLPPSPRWLTLRGQQAEADAVWETLGIKPEDRQKIVNGLEGGEGVVDDSDSTRSPLPVGDLEKEQDAEPRFLDLFKRDVRGRTMFAVMLMGMLQLSGIDAVLYYAPLLFQHAGLTSSESSFLASGISGIILVLVSIPALLFADKWGRRTSTILGGLGLTTTMIVMGSLYASGAVHESRGAARWVVVVCIYLYAVFFATTWAVSIKVYAPEIQPQRTRAKATALAHGCNWVCNFFVAFICPVLLAKSSFGLYFLFGGCTAVTTV
ncbi:general substrate transporter, partial [Glonium stellatum]